MNKTFLIMTAIHGDERLGPKVMEKIEKKLPRDQYGYDWIVANEKAFKKNVRFTEVDLNRNAPGNNTSAVYEEKRAAEIIELSRNYSFVLDIHGTNAKSGIFVLVTNPTPENLLLTSYLPIKNVVVWAANSSKVKGPITQYTKCPAVEIECGPKSSAQVQTQLQEIISKIITNRSQTTIENLFSSSRRQHFFQVYGSVENIDTSNMKEFEEFEMNGEKFYCLLINSYKDGSARKMKKLNLFNALSY